MGSGRRIFALNPQTIGFRTLLLVALLQLPQMNEVKCTSMDAYNSEEYWHDETAQPEHFIGTAIDHPGILPSVTDSEWLDYDGNDDDNDVSKRHLGSLLSSANSVPGSFGVSAGKRHLGSVLSKSNKVDKESIKNTKRYLGALMRTREPSSVSGTWDETWGEPSLVKSKRFLGSMARGGWFPRQFRGFVGENQYNKRHIGAVARLGLLPSRQDSSVENGMDMGYKRNIQALKNMESSNRWSSGVRPREY